jgi:hypothetical protein
MILIMIVFAMGFCLGIEVGILISALFDHWSKSAAKWIMSKIFPSPKSEPTETK